MYNKLDSETSKITQNHRIQDMDSIKDDTWSSFLYKHKEFQQSLLDITNSVSFRLLGPIAEVVLNTSEFLKKYSENNAKVSNSANLYLETLESELKYPISIKYSQKTLKKYSLEQSFQYIRSRIIEVNSEAIQTYTAINSDELSINIGDKLEIRDGVYHQHWCKALREDGKTGFIPSSSVMIYKYSTIIAELKDNYDIANLTSDDVIKTIKTTQDKFLQIISKFPEAKQDALTTKIFLQLEFKLKTLIKANKLFSKELKENIEKAFEDFVVYLSIYLDTYNIIELSSQLLTDEHKKSLMFIDLTDEIMDIIQNFLLFDLQKFVYSYWSIQKSSKFYEILDIISSLQWKLDKSIFIIPNHEDMNNFLQDPKNVPIKKISFEQSSLVLVPNFVVIASLPFKIKNIIPISFVLHVYVFDETLVIKTRLGSFLFTFNSNKKAVEWMFEVENLIILESNVCTICRDSNLLKRIKPCQVCRKRICVLCKCNHS